MAEVVMNRMERMIPEYNEMKRREIFTEDEIKDIQKKRDKFEYKLASPGNSGSEKIVIFCEYITYERKLLGIVCKREKTQNLNSLGLSIANHVKDLYKEAIRLFPHELRFWENFIKFATKCKFISEVSVTFQNMLQFHGSVPGVWLEAAMWEYNETHDMKKVKDLFFRGLQRHPKEEQLYIEFMKVMLLETVKTHSGSQVEQDLSLEQVAKIYEHSKRKIRNVKYLAQVLEIIEKYPCAKSLQLQILQDMIKLFPRDEIMFHTMAQCELRGLEAYELLKKNRESLQGKENMDDTEHSETSENEDVEMKGSITCSEGLPKSSLRHRILSCVDVYKAAIKELETREMWTLYINAMLELSLDVSEEKLLKYDCLMKAFEEAFNVIGLTENHYTFYIKLLGEHDTSEEKLFEVMEKATSAFPQSTKIWKLRILHYVARNDPKRLDEIFQKAVKELGPNSYDLWRIRLEFYQTRYDLNKVEEVFSETVKQTRPEFLCFRVQYLEWTSLDKTIEEIREIYNNLTKLNPPCLELHECMISLESNQLKPNINEWRRCYEYLTEFFGRNRPEVWMNYIKFERDHGDPKKLSSIYERAERILHPRFVDNFISEYSLLRTEIKLEHAD